MFRALRLKHIGDDKQSIAALCEDLLGRDIELNLPTNLVHRSN
ncbi:hypothetical protein Q3C01_15760 [Bradyrhizobium sp. UFLA05-109]